MKNKKVLTILIALILIAGLMLTSCNSGEPEQEQGEVSQEEETLNDLRPMMVVKGRLYFDTGKESEQLRRCCVMSGVITSTVEPNEIPTEDDQSNFGTGYYYQSTLEDNLLEVNMDGKWIVFETLDEVEALPETIDVEVELDIEHVNDAWLAQYDDYDEFIIEESEYMTKVALTTNVPIDDFKVVRIDFESTDDDITFYPVEELYVLDEFMPERPFVIGLVDYGSIPHFGISFEDNCGIIHNYSFNFSGKDGSPLLTEIS